jgi:hypothetical protein
MTNCGYGLRFDAIFRVLHMGGTKIFSVGAKLKKIKRRRRKKLIFEGLLHKNIHFYGDFSNF